MKLVFGILEVFTLTRLPRLRPKQFTIICVRITLIKIFALSHNESGIMKFTSHTKTNRCPEVKLPVRVFCVFKTLQVPCLLSLSATAFLHFIHTFAVKIIKNTFLYIILMFYIFFISQIHADYIEVIKKHLPKCFVEMQSFEVENKVSEIFVFMFTLIKHTYKSHYLHFEHSHSMPN